MTCHAIAALHWRGGGPFRMLTHIMGAPHGVPDLGVQMCTPQQHAGASHLSCLSATGPTAMRTRSPS